MAFTMKTIHQNLHTTVMLLAWLTLSLCGAGVTATARSRSRCEGGQEDGDKWFDGCRWCVCENSVAVCSSSECSHLNAQLPACQNLGSRWWDGCYQCACFPHGIECRADRTCVASVHSRRLSSRSARLLSQGACIKPQDDRCVCGVDGVPSCTADAIDRNAVEATTISLVPTRGPPTLMEYKSRRPARPSFDMRRHMRERLSRYGDRSKGSSYTNSYGLGPRRSARPGPRRLRSRARRSLPDISLHTDLRRVRSETGQPAPQRVTRSDRILRSLVDLPLRAQRSLLAGTARRHKRCVRCNTRTIQSDEAAGYNFRALPSGSSQSSPSLLVTTDNRCRWGSRWYGGSLRCYCDESGSITCGDPSFVATRIDGFLMDRTPCQPGHAWEDRQNCRFCECQVSGVAMCWRSVACSVPFLIAPVVPSREPPSVPARDTQFADPIEPMSGSDFDDDDEDDEDVPFFFDIPPPEDTATDDKDDNDEESNDPSLHIIRYKEKQPHAGVMGSNRVEDLTGSGLGNSETLVTEGPRIKAPPRPNTRGSSSRGSTMVIVRECRPHRRWRDGCKRCSCDSRGKKRCDDRMCLKVVGPSPKSPFDLNNKPSRDPGSIEVGSGSMLNGRLVQKPPPDWSSLREGPVAPTFELAKNPCGKFKLNEVYWMDCNLCRCLKTGPRCTALSC